MVFTHSAAGRMQAGHSRAWELRPWELLPWRSRPSLDPTIIAKPFGGGLLVLVVVLAGALVVHALHRATDRPVAEIHGDIVGPARVIDGDTIRMAGSRIRLQGIDAPESDQTCTDTRNRKWLCGQAATRVLIGFIAGRPLKCETSGFDRYRRVLAVCALPDGSDVNAWIVQQGWALAYYSDAYRAQEAEAHAAKRGIWAGSFMPPWEWRHRHLH